MSANTTTDDSTELNRITAQDIKRMLDCDIGTATRIIQEADAETYDDLLAAARTHTIDGTNSIEDEQLEAKITAKNTGGVLCL